MLILGLDFETTWLTPIDPSEMRIIEAGAVLYDTERQMPVDMFNKLVRVDQHLFTEDITKLTGITMDDLQTKGISTQNAMRELNLLIDQAEFIVAHNGNQFDRPVYVAECIRNNVAPLQTPWIDTRTDVIYPEHIKTRKLTHLAADHGFANPFAHRALFDVLTMLKVLSLYDIQDVVARSKEASYLVTASVSYHDREQAKERGYFWNGDDKKWQKECKESDLKIEEEHAPFMVASKEIEK